jgi:hypothetical protein
MTQLTQPQIGECLDDFAFSALTRPLAPLTRLTQPPRVGRLPARRDPADLAPHTP